jgi:hypothetical protein
VSTSRLEGTIQDESGAIVPGAKVEAVNTKTGIATQVTSDSAGRYIFQSLVPGLYNISVEAAGFRKSVLPKLTLNVGDTVTQVMKLEIGSVVEAVTVEANALRVQTADAQLSNIVTLRDIETLPQLGRSPMNLAVFNTGIQIDVSSGYSYSRVNGLRQGSNNATLDGIEVNDPVVPRLGLSMTPNTTDTVAEFRMVTNGGKAEYGRNAGGQIEMISRSGSNEFHGGAWDYLRNTDLNANTFFSNQTGQTRPKLIQNQFGGNFAGRIIKDKTFFFGDYDGVRTRQEKLVNRTTLTPSLRSGIFKWKSTADGSIQSYNIFANDPRHIGMDPWAKTHYYDLMPDANNFDTGDGLNTGGYRFNASNNSFNDQYTLKFDHQLTATHHLFFRWSWMRTYSTDGTNGAEASYPGLPAGQQGGHRNGWSAGSTWTLSSSMVNDLRVGGQKSNSDFLRPRLHEAMMSASLFTDPLGPSDFGQGRTVPSIQIIDNLTRTSGSHTYKAGVQLRFITQDGWRDDYAWPFVATYSNQNGNNTPAGIGPTVGISSADKTRFDNAYADLLGRITYVRQTFYSDLAKFQPAGTSRFRSTKNREYGFFFQDDWKVTRRLTLNLGIRYELMSVPFDANGYQGTLEPAASINALSASNTISVQKGGSWFKNDYNNFAPRFGFAWDPKGDGKWVVRGGGGIFYDRMINAVLSAVDLNTPGFNQQVTVFPNQNGTDVRLNDGIPATPQPTAPSLSIPNNRIQAGAVMSPDLRTGYAANFNLSVQRELFRNTILEASYVGTRGIKMFYQDQVNQFKVFDSGFFSAFKELQAFDANGTAPSANNLLVKMFGSAATAVSRVGATNLRNGVVGTAASTIDTNYYTSYAGAGLPDTWLRSFPQFGTMYVGTNDGRSYYNSFQTSLRRQAGALKFGLNYTFAKSMDNWANEGNGTSGGSVIDYRNVRLNRGLSDFDRPHTFNSSASYTLPVGRGRRYLGSANRLVDALVGGWDLGGLTTWQSGVPLSIVTGRATGANSAASAWAVYSGTDRSIGKLDRQGGGVYFFTAEQMAQFTFPAAGYLGSTGRNTFRGPRFFNVDASLSKAFKVTETKSFKFRAEAYNLFNNVNFGNPGLSIATASSFGKFSSTIGPNGSGGARLMQMALRFDF